MTWKDELKKAPPRVNPQRETKKPRQEYEFDNMQEYEVERLFESEIDWEVEKANERNEAYAFISIEGTELENFSPKVLNKWVKHFYGKKLGYKTSRYDPRGRNVEIKMR